MLPRRDGAGDREQRDSQPPQGKEVVEPSGIEPPTARDLQSVSVRQGSRRFGFHRQQKDLRVPEVRWRPLRFAGVRPEIVALLPRVNRTLHPRTALRVGTTCASLYKKRKRSSVE